MTSISDQNNLCIFLHRQSVGKIVQVFNTDRTIDIVKPWGIIAQEITVFENPLVFYITMSRKVEIYQIACLTFLLNIIHGLINGRPGSLLVGQ